MQYNRRFWVLLPIICVGFFSIFFFTRIQAANNTLAIVLPPVATTSTDSSLMLAAATHDAIVISGTLAASDRVTLAASGGTLSLAQTTGLSFDSGDGSADASMTFGGSSADVNSALDGLMLAPPASFSGRITLTVSVAASNPVTATLPVAVNAIVDGAAARTTILNGVSTVHSGVQPSHQAAFGEQAYAIAWYPEGSGSGAMIAAASYGSGRVISMPDHQMLNMGSYGDQGTGGTYYKNGLAWLADSTSTSIAIVTTHSGTATWLTDEGYTNVTYVSTSGLAAALTSADVYIGWLGSSITDTNLAALKNFALNGGGLYIAEYAVGYSWWWGKPYYEAPGNMLLREAGIVFGGSNRWDTGLLDATQTASGHIDAAAIFAILGGDNSYTSAQQDEAGVNMGFLFDGLAPDDPLLKRLDDQFYARINNINPTPATPVSDSFEQALLQREASLLLATDPFEVKAHRTVTNVYGAIPAGAARVTQNVGIDMSRGRWHATGLYVVPGEVVTVTVPAELVNSDYRIRISPHTDNIAPRDAWYRVPRIHRSFTLENAVTPIASAFGGAIFIDTGGNNYSEISTSGIATITVENVTHQPYFVLGQHTDQQWNDTLKDYPAPWATLVSDNVIIHLPKSYVADLTQPEALMTWWNEVVAGQDELVGRYTPRTAAEIINIDVQNSAGAAHAGFPIQAYMEHWGNPANYEGLTSGGSWGDFHELGHNHQRGWWTFDGDGEVTVNIFSNYNLEKDVSAPGPGGWGYSADPKANLLRATIDVGSGGTYSSKASRWSFWFQLADGFGWDMYRQVFRTYEDDHNSARGTLPTTDAEEKEQWFLRWSQESGWDMKRFMVDTWGLTVSQSVIDQVAALPDWMPIIGGVAEVDMMSAETHTFDLEGTALTMDSTATLIAAGSPTHGQLVTSRAGSVTYTAPYDFQGTDTFTYTLKSSADNTETFTATINIRIDGGLLETWWGIDGTDLSQLRADADYPNTPDQTDLLDNMQSASGRGSDYGSRLRAIITPPTTGDYIFYIASDDDGELWLSPNWDPNAAVQIASVDGWTSELQWDKYSSQTSAVQTLTAGERYYIEALVKEDGGGDHLAIAWSGPGIPQTVISKQYIDIYGIGADPTTLSEPLLLAEDSSATVPVLDNDSDPNGDTLIVGTARTLTGSPVTINANHTLAYTPTADFTGYDVITYTVADKYGNHATGFVGVEVTAEPDAPVLANQSFELYAQSPNATEVGSASGSDPDGDTLSYSIVNGNTGSAFSIDGGNGTLSVADQSAVAAQSRFTLTVRADDGSPSRLATDATVIVDVFDCPDSLVVSSSADAGPCTLRSAISAANTNDTVTFASRMANRTITLASTLNITRDMTIDGGGTRVTIDGDTDGDGSGDLLIFDISDYDDLVIKGLTVQNGRSDVGGIFVRWYGSVTIIESLIANHTNTYWGGGAIHSQGSVKIYNSTFTGNHNNRSTGNAIAIRGSGNEIINATFVDNTGPSDSGTVSAGSGTTWEMTNTLISSSSGVGCSGDAPTSGSNNLVWDGGCSAALSSAVNVGPLQDNGGPTHTYALLETSPALNAGDTTACTASPINGIDQRGNARPADSCDIGAYEASADEFNTPTSVGLRSAEASQFTTIALVALATILLTGLTLALKSKGIKR